MIDYVVNQSCRICNGDLHKFFTHEKRIPLAGAFGNIHECKINDKLFPLSLSVCEKCFLIQCNEVIDKRILFNEKYAYHSSTIFSVNQHFQNLSEHISRQYPSNYTILEIGCNDGVLLKKLSEKGFKCIGVDPINIKPQNNEYIFYGEYFNVDVCQKIVREHGKVDLFVSSNSFAHIDDMSQVLQGMRNVIKENGFAVIEVHDSKQIFQHNQFDFIYHEHMSYYTLQSIQYLVTHFLKMLIVDIEFTPLHGQSMRIYIQNRVGITCQKVTSLLHKERMFRQIEFYQSFDTMIQNWKVNMANLFDTLSHENKDESVTYIGYGASGRANTLCSFFDFPITEIIDDSKYRIGCVMPVTHHIIIDSEILNVKNYNYIIILAWPYKDTIMSNVLKKHPKYKSKFIIPLPTPVLI